MKKLLLTCLAVLAFVSCDKTVKPISVTVSIVETAFEEGVPAPESYEVKLVNIATNVETTAQTANGIATIAGILPGIYNISAAAVVTRDGFAYNIAGSASNVNFATDAQNQPIEVSAVKSSALIFKEIYTACAGETYYIRDQYYEVYNNSSETVYVDGLCIAACVYASYDGVRYNWQIADPEKYVFAEVVWQLPGSGNEYPLKPGESIIIAQWAVNHQNENLNPASPVDLSGAEFEAVEKESTLWNGLVITDNAAVNMKKVVMAGYGYEMPQWMTAASGAPYIIFFPEGGSLSNEDYIAVDGSSYTAREIPIGCIVDAVEAVADETIVANKCFSAPLDAGAIWWSAPYSGESISRKIFETKEDGRVVYQDTNNTTNDFVVNKTPVIRRDNAGTPSWNTWKK